MVPVLGSQQKVYKTAGLFSKTSREVLQTVEFVHHMSGATSRSGSNLPLSSFDLTICAAGTDHDFGQDLTFADVVTEINNTEKPFCLFNKNQDSFFRLLKTFTVLMVELQVSFNRLTDRTDAGTLNTEGLNVCLKR